MTRLLSNLHIGTPLGSGFFGEVFTGRDDVHGMVAVKVIKQDAGESPLDWHGRRTGLLKEGQRLAQATHSNIAKVHHIVESEVGDSICLVMELCSGGSLQPAFEKGPMSLATVRKIATEVTLGLHALHSRGMIHRDIKPSNILIDANKAAKLGDFGLVVRHTWIDG